MPGPDHGASVEHGIHLGDATPEQRAVPEEAALVGVALRPGRTVDPVGRDDEVCLELPVVELRHGLLVVPSDSHESASQMDGVLPTRSVTATRSTSCSRPRWMESWGQG